MRRLSVLAALLAFTAAPSLAEPLPDGLYAGHGGELKMRVAGRSATVTVSAIRCIGEVSGSFADAGPGAWLFTASEPIMDQVCHIGIRRQANGAMALSEQRGCSYWHGMSCGFSGTVSR